TEAQERLWFLHQLAPNGPASNQLRAFRLRGPLDLAGLEHGLAALAARQAILRATLRVESGGPRLAVAAPVPVSLAVAVAGSLPVARRASRPAASAEPASQRASALPAGPPWRARLLRLAPDDHVLVLVAHRIILDDGSLPVLLSELAALYASAMTGTPPDLP